MAVRALYCVQAYRVDAQTTVPLLQLLYDVGVNLLAHAFLADSDPDKIVGQLCGDFVRGSDLSVFSPAVQAGIRCHRAVDSFTDQHSDNIAARALFTPPHRRFAGIAVDVVYDHFLACDWQQYSELPLKNYTTLVTRSLEANLQLLPTGLQRFKNLLDIEDTLYRNVDRDHIELTLQRIAGRRKSLAPLATIAPLVWECESELKSLFESFFPQLISYTRSYQEKLAAEKLD